MQNQKIHQLEANISNGKTLKIRQDDLFWIFAYINDCMFLLAFKSKWIIEQKRSYIHDGDHFFGSFQR